MQKENYKDLNKFLSSIHMGTKAFKIYKDKAEDEKLIEIIDDVIYQFNEHEKSITKLVEDNGMDPADDLTIAGEVAMMFEKLKMPKNDFYLSLEAIKGINMGITNGLEFIHEHLDYDDETLSKLKHVIGDYDYLIDKFNSHVIDTYLTNI